MMKLVKHFFVKTDNSPRFPLGERKCGSLVSDFVTHRVSFPRFIECREIAFFNPFQPFAERVPVVSHFGNHFIENDIRLEHREPPITFPVGVKMRKYPLPPFLSGILALALLSMTFALYDIMVFCLMDDLINAQKAVDDSNNEQE